MLTPQQRCLFLFLYKHKHIGLTPPPSHTHTQAARLACLHHPALVISASGSASRTSRHRRQPARRRRSPHPASYRHSHLNSQRNSHRQTSGCRLGRGRARSGGDRSPRLLRLAGMALPPNSAGRRLLPPRPRHSAASRCAINRVFRCIYIYRFIHI